MIIPEALIVMATLLLWAASPVRLGLDSSVPESK